LKRWGRCKGGLKQDVKAKVGGWTMDLLE